MAKRKHPNQGLAEPEVAADEAKTTELKCEFSIDDEGRPVLNCADDESQARAVRAMEAHPEVSVRVRPKVEEA